MEKGVFKVIYRLLLPLGIQLFNSRFIDEIKHLGTSELYKKSRLIIQAYNNYKKELVLIQSPTIQ